MFSSFGAFAQIRVFYDDCKMVTLQHYPPVHITSWHSEFYQPSPAICLSSSLVYLSSAWTWGFLFYLLGNYLLLFVLMPKSDLASGSPSGWLLYPVFFVLFVFSILLFGTASLFWFIWYLPIFLVAQRVKRSQP